MHTHKKYKNIQIYTYARVHTCMQAFSHKLTL